MSILDIRLWFATEAGLIVSIIGVLLAMIALLIVVNSKNRFTRIGICLFSSLIIILIIANMFDIKSNYLDIPKVEGIDTKIA